MKYIIRKDKSILLTEIDDENTMWEIWQGDEKYLVKNYVVTAPMLDKNDENGWFMECEGKLTIDETLTAFVCPDKP